MCTHVCMSLRVCVNAGVCGPEHMCRRQSTSSDVSSCLNFVEREPSMTYSRDVTCLSLLYPRGLLGLQTLWGVWYLLGPGV